MENTKEQKKLVNSYTFDVRGVEIKTLKMTANLSGRLAGMMRSGDTFVDYDPSMFQKLLDVLTNPKLQESRNISDEDLEWFECTLFVRYCDYCKEKLDNRSKIRCSSCENNNSFETHKTRCYFCTEEFYASMDGLVDKGSNVGPYKFHKCCYEICNIEIDPFSDENHTYHKFNLLYHWRNNNKLYCIKHLKCDGNFILSDDRLNNLAIKAINELRTAMLGKNKN